MATPSRSGREWLREPTSAFQMLIMRLNEFEVMHTVSSILSSVNLLSMFLVQLTRICLQNGHTRTNNPFNWGRAWGRTLETLLFLTEASSTSVVLVPDPGIASQHLHLRAMWCVKHPFNIWNHFSFYSLHLEIICFTMQEAYLPFYVT